MELNREKLKFSYITGLYKTLLNVSFIGVLGTIAMIIITIQNAVKGVFSLRPLLLWGVGIGVIIFITWRLYDLYDLLEKKKTDSKRNFLNFIVLGLGIVSGLAFSGLLASGIFIYGRKLLMKLI